MRRCGLVLILVLAVLLPGSPWSRVHGAAAPASAGPHLVRSDESGVVLELSTPAYDLTTEPLSALRLAHHDAGSFQRLSVAGYDVTQEAGQPQLPVMNTLLGVPPDTQIELRILADDTTPLPGRHSLSPAPRPAPLTDDLQPGKLVFEPDQIAYTTDALYPALPARIAGEAWLRDQRIVRVEIYPFQYNPAMGTLLWHRRLRVEVRFTAPTPRPHTRQLKGAGLAKPLGLDTRLKPLLDRRFRLKLTRMPPGPSPNPGGGEVDSTFSHFPPGAYPEQGRRVGGSREGARADPFDPLLRRALLNYDTARAWRGRPVSVEQGNHPDFANPKSEIRNPKLKITVDHDALYRISYEDLRAAGMDLDSVDPRTFHLTSQGEEVAIYVAGEDDGRFDPGDTITFYGQKFRGARLAERYAGEMADWLVLCPKCELAGMFEKYTDENVYWLTAGDTPGPRMVSIDGTPTDTAPAPSFYRATVHAEQSREWYTHHFTSEDTWFWDRVQTGFDPITRTYTTTLTALAGGTFTATVRGEVVARNSGAHDTRFLLNNRSAPLDRSTWSGKTNHTFEVQVNQSDLNEGENELHFVSDGDLDWVYFNWFEIEYARRFEAEDDQLLIPGEAAGTWQYEIDGFSAPDVQVYDVTDPLAPQRVLNPRATPLAAKTSEVPETSEVVSVQGVSRLASRVARNDVLSLSKGDVERVSRQRPEPVEGGAGWQGLVAWVAPPSTGPSTGSGGTSGRRFDTASTMFRPTQGAIWLSPERLPEVYRLAFEATHDVGARFLAVAAPAVQSPKAITRYTPPDLRSPENGADYIIITHRKFYAAVQRLADYRAGQGMRVTVVDVDDLYSEFNYGIFHPIAIRNFLAYAYVNWQPPAPSYVLLVGDGHWNFKGYGIERYGEPTPIYMPPNLAFVDPWQGEVDSTNLLAAIVGDDILPDLAIGRLPVDSVAELDAAIDKIIAYEQAAPADWQRHSLFVADNVPDAAGDFVWLADDIIANHVPASMEADRIYLNDYCGAPASPPQPCPAVNAAIVDQLNETGALFVSYIGHASVERWAHERIFVNDDIPALTNGDRLPVVLSMTCLDGYFYYPNRPSLAEELVRADGYGAVSTFSPSGLGVATGHHVMQRRFYDAVFKDGVRELGPATLAAKAALYATGWNYDLIHTFTIFGDPALRLQLPASEVYLPLVSR